MYRTIWRFVVRPESAAEFERHYGPSGTWAQLFRKGAGYIGTELFRSTEQPDVYVTVDTWESRAAYEAFKREHHDEYAALDQRFEDFTRSEEHLGG